MPNRIEIADIKVEPYATFDGVFEPLAGLYAARRLLTGAAVAAGAERRPSDAKYDDGDCDGYNSEPGGKTMIFEWDQSDINKWEKRLKATGVKPEVYRTSKTGKHCWVRFDTDLLNGVSWEGRGINPENDDMDILANGTLFHFKELKALHYAETLAVSLIVTLSERLPKPRKNGTRRQLSSYSQTGRRKPRTL